MAFREVPRHIVFEGHGINLYCIGHFLLRWKMSGKAWFLAWANVGYVPMLLCVYARNASISLMLFSSFSILLFLTTCDWRSTFWWLLSHKPIASHPNILTILRLLGRPVLPLVMPQYTIALSLQRATIRISKACRIIVLLILQVTTRYHVLALHLDPGLNFVMQESL